MTSRRNQRNRRRFEAKLLIEKLKSGPCEDCSGEFHHCQMDLFHAKAGKRVSTLLLKSKDRILDEAKKCLLLCANCARLRSWTQSRQSRSD